MASECGSKRSLSIPGTLLMFTLLVPLAHASVLGVGGTAPPSPLTPGGTVLAMRSGVITPPIAPDFTANYTTWVYRDPNNTWCVNCLDFVYQFTNNGPAVNERYSMSDFSGFKVDAGTSPFGMHDPITVSRSFNGSGPVLSFNFDQFGDEIKPGEQTVLLVLETNAMNFTQGVVSAQNGTAGSNLAYQPSGAPVPEPASMALLGGGLIAVGGYLRRSRLMS